MCCNCTNIVYLNKLEHVSFLAFPLLKLMCLFFIHLTGGVRPFHLLTANKSHPSQHVTFQSKIFRDDLFARNQYFWQIKYADILKISIS